MVRDKSYFYTMATIESKYLGNLRTQARHCASGSEIITDAPLDNMGKGEAFSPTDLLSASLGSCMLTLMGIAGNTHGINIDNTELKITKIMASNPRRVGEIQIDFFFSNHDLNDHEKLILERAARTCPVALSIHPDVKQTITFIW